MSSSARGCWRWLLDDTLQPDLNMIQSAAEVEEFQQKHHTYRYRISGGGHESSRIDRWYISSRSREWIRRCSRDKAPCRADHDGAQVTFADPARRRFAKCQRRIYPARPYAATAVRTTCISMITRLHNRLAASGTPDALLTEWDRFKGRLVQTIEVTERKCRIKMRASHKQCVRRLRAHIASLKTSPT